MNHAKLPLLLLRGGLFSLCGSTLSPHTSILLVSSRRPQLNVSLLLGWVVLDVALLDLDDIDDWQKCAGLAEHVLARPGSLDLVGGCITLLLLASLAREENEALLVLLEALDVGLQRLFRDVLATRIDADADGGSQFAWDASLLSSN